MPDIDFHLNIACSYTGVIKDIELSVIIYIVHLIYCTLKIQCKCCKMTDATACECLCIDQISADC